MAVKVGTALSLVGAKGPTGDQGQATPALGTVCFAAGPQAYLSAGASTAAGVYMGVAGAVAQPAIYIPADATALLGATIINYGSSTASFSFALVNVTTGTTIYTSAAYAANTVNTVGVFSQTAYAMPKGNTYQWKCIGAGTAYAAVQPYYMLPANTGIAASQLQSFSLPNSATLSGTLQPMFLPGTTQASYIRLPRAGYIYSITIINNCPQPVSVQLYNATANGTSIAWNCAAGTTVQLGPFGPVTAALALNSNYQLRAQTGNGTTVTADLQVQLSVVS